jgi:hypothetical protein
MLFLALSISAAATLDVDPWSLVRVDTPDHPQAEASSAHGSLLLAPPSHGAWRTAPIPEITELPDAVAHEAPTAVGAGPWHDAGQRGAGVELAIFDLQWFPDTLDPSLIGEAQTHDCHAHDSCAVPMDMARPRFGFEWGAHGLACAEVVRAIAPEASLHFVRVNGLTTLENAVDWAIREGIDVVSMSLSFFGESFHDGHGPVNEQIERLWAAGILMVTSAGNYADEHWSGTPTDADRDGVLELDGQARLALHFTAGTHRVFISWDEFGDCSTDLSATVFDGSGAIVGQADAPQEPGGSCNPVERVLVHVAADGWHDLQLRHGGAGPLPRVKIFARNGEIWQGRAAGSITDPGSSRAALTVGAITVDPGDLTAYLSDLRSRAFNGRAGPQIVLISPIACAGFRFLGQVRVQFMMVWQR